MIATSNGPVHRSPHRSRPDDGGARRRQQHGSARRDPARLPRRWGVFDADDPHGVAFFDAVARPEPRLSFSDVHSEAHVPGRHLNGLLAAEGLAGVAVDDAVVRRHRAALFFSFSGDVPLPLNRARRRRPARALLPAQRPRGSARPCGARPLAGRRRGRRLARRSVAFIAANWAPPTTGRRRSRRPTAPPDARPRAWAGDRAAREAPATGDEAA